LGLAAVGVVSLASAARADEKMSQLNTALSNTTISGYADVGVQYVNATGAPYANSGPSAVADGITMNTVDIALDKPMDATPFSAGYHIELWSGGSNNQLGTGSILRQAYLALGTTVGGQEIDWKIGVWDTIIGYEGLTSSANPNYTHSYGFAVEPTTHTGIQANYKVNDSVSLQAGIADDSLANGVYTAAIDGSSVGAGGPLHHPTTMAAIALTAPDSFGALKGATLTIGGMNTADPSGGFGDSVYVGATIPTSLAALKFGGSFDYFDSSFDGGHVWVAGAYATYQASDKLTFAVRGETYDQTAPIVATTTVINGLPAGALNKLTAGTGVSPAQVAQVLSSPAFVNLAQTVGIPGFTSTSASQHGEELTATASYQLWANVLSRVELRWDHADDAAVFASTAGGGLERNSLFAGAQLIYSF
jgi:hypothetical protein